MGNKQQAGKKDDKSPEPLSYEQKLFQTYVSNPEVQKQLNSTGKLPFFNPNDPSLSHRKANNFDEFGNRTHDSGHVNAYGSNSNIYAGLANHEEFQNSNDLSSVPKLQAQNARLERQLETLKAQMNEYLQKEKEEKESKVLSQSTPPVHDSEAERKIKEIKAELGKVYKEIEHHQKELQIVQVQSHNTKAIAQFEGAGNKLSEKKVEVKCLELEKKTLEKTLKEKNKLLRELHEVHDNPFVKSNEEPSIADEFKAIKQKVREGIKHEQMLEKEAQARNQHIMKLLGELNKKKESYKLLLGKTGYDPIDGRVKLVAHSKSPQPRSSQSPGRSFGRPVLKKGSGEHESSRVDMTEPNFEHLKDEFSTLQSEEARKQKAFKAKAAQLKEKMVEVEKDKQDLSKKLIEKDKEGVILRNKAREIYRILLQNNLLEPGNAYEALFNDKAKSQSPKVAVKKNKPLLINRSLSLTLKNNLEGALVNESWAGHENKNVLNLKPVMSEQSSLEPFKSKGDAGKGGNFFMTSGPTSPQSSNTMKDNFVKKPTAVQRSNSMKSKTKLAYKGFRMDEIGKPADKDPIGDFNDQELIGDRNVVRIASVRVWYSNDGIAGLQPKYRDTKGKIIDGEEHVTNREKCLIMDLNLGLGDFLHGVSGFIDNGKGIIESLVLVSKNGESISVGKKKPKSTPFKFDINDLEYPALFHGSLKEGAKGKPSILCKFGVFIRSEEIEEEIQSPKNSKQR